MWFVLCKYLHFACILGLLASLGVRFALHRWAGPTQQRKEPYWRGLSHALLAGVILSGVALLGFAGEAVTDYYFSNAWFLIKMALLGLAIAVGLWGNRYRLLGQRPPPDATGPATVLARQVAVILLIPLAALLMTRRVWMFEWTFPQPVKEQQKVESPTHPTPPSPASGLP